MIVGLYVPGNSFIHTQRPGLKLFILFGLGIGLVTVQSLTLLAALSFTVATLYIRFAALGFNRLWQSTRPLVLWLVLIGVAQIIVADTESAMRIVLRLLTLVWAATLVTHTARLTEMTECLVFMCGAVRPLGFSSSRMAFMIALTVRLIPALSDVVKEVRDAQRARGLERSIFATIVPVLIRIFQQADVMSDALMARGYDCWDDGR